MEWKIVNNSPVLFDKNGEVKVCGSIRLSPDIDIWYSPSHDFKTYKEALSAVKLILASHDLLDALINCRDGMKLVSKYYPSAISYVNQANEAIKKATE